MKVTKSAYPLNIILMDILDKAVAVTERTDGEALAKEVCQNLQDKIRSDDFNFEIDPSSDYNIRKDASGRIGAGIPLMDTGEYVKSIQVVKIANGYSIGVEDKFHPILREGQKPIHMRHLARVLEYGYKPGHQAPYPHWRPALANLRRRKVALSAELKKKVARRMQDALNEYLNQARNKEIRTY
jgi:hypothetical protein